MGLRVILLVVLASGCHLVFDVDLPPPPDTGDPCKVGHDEDDDGVSDACDNCVGIANPLQEDTTEDQSAGVSADGVGDACDPNPTARDNVSLEITFAGADENNQWSVVSAQTGWRFDRESAIFEGTAPGTQAVLRSTREQPSRPFVIEYQVTVNAPYDDGVIGIRVDTNRDVPEMDDQSFGVECGVAHLGRLDIEGNPTGPPVAYSSSGHRNAPPLAENGLLVELPSKATRYRVLMRYDVSTTDMEHDMRCIVQTESQIKSGEPGTQSQISVVTPVPIGTDLAIAAVTAAARIDYIVIYSPL